MLTSAIKKAVVLQFTFMRKKVEAAALKEIQAWDEMDMILMQIRDASVHLFSEEND